MMSLYVIIIKHIAASPVDIEEILVAANHRPGGADTLHIKK